MTQYFKHQRSITIQTATLVVAALLSANAFAANAVIVRSTSFWSGADNILDSFGDITASNFGDPVSYPSYTGNPLLNNSADGRTGNWYTFEKQQGGGDVTVTVNGSPDFVPGFTVWATNGPFDGGTPSNEIQLNFSAYSSTPHVMNATGQLGDLGTQWMQDGQGGNALATLGYAVANEAINITDGSTSWGEDVVSGAHGYTTTFNTGWAGNASGNSASLTFNNLAAGWYTVFIGGTDSTSGFSGEFDLVVSAVPETETWTMLLAGLGLIGWRLKKQARYEPSMIPA